MVIAVELKGLFECMQRLIYGGYTCFETYARQNTG